MSITPTPKIWMNGSLVDWDDARIHVLTHSLHYGMGVFEGIRAYETSEGPAVFRLTDHMQRLHDSARIMMMELPYSVEELVEATKDVVRASQAAAQLTRHCHPTAGRARRSACGLSIHEPAAHRSGPRV